MGREDKESIIQQMAEELTRKLLKSSVEAKQKAFIFFCEETTEVLRSKVLALLPNEEVLANTTVEKINSLDTCKAVVVVAPSIDLAAKITTLQTDCPVSSLVIKALFTNKRVIILPTGALIATNTLRAGLRKAVEDLRYKLIEMGVEFASLADLTQIIDTPMAESMENKLKPEEQGHVIDLVDTAISNLVKNPEPVFIANSIQRGSSSTLPVVVYPISLPSQHPSQIKMASKDELTDFVEFLQTKQCTMEKDKPCDRCDICNTLGF